MAVLYSPIGGLYAHICSSAQLFAPEYKHHRKVDPRSTLGDPFGRVDFDLTSMVCMHAMRRDHTTLTGVPAASTASGMLAVMIDKQPG